MIGPNLIKRFFLVLFLFCAFTQNSNGDTADDVERHVKSALIYQFTKLIEWPAKDGDFLIYVIEDEALLTVLTDVTAQKTVGSRKIVVQATKWADAVLKPGDIVVFPKIETSFHKAVIQKLKRKTCLTVANSDGLGEAGSIINFFLADGKLRFELNQDSAKENYLKIDPNLAKLAKIVK